jgi:pimeloyl-ACP methyl ester carboxylesterase
LLAEGSEAEIHEVHIEVGGRDVRALCTPGRRRVLLLHGEGSDADTWRPVLRRLDGSVGACAYDRLGSGAGDAEPRGWFELVDDLRAIHLALGYEQGYVLVGQGLGGLYARLFATDRPRDVTGLVLVDPAHEDLPSRMRLGMPAAEWDAWMKRRQEPNEDGVRVAALAERARSARLPNMPVTVITASLRRDGDGWNARYLNEAARQMHEEILRGITSARHVPAPRSGPDVQIDQPDLVTEEILRVTRAVTP